MRREKKKIIIGLAGIIASGKDTVADYLVKKYNAEKVSFSEPLRDILNRLYLPIDRAHLSGLAQILIDRFGPDVLSKTIAKGIEQSEKEIFVLPNIRRKEDYSALEKFNGFVLVGLKTDKRKCYERLLERGQNKDDKTKTWAEFEKDLQLSTEIKIPELVKKAKIVLDNNRPVENLHIQIDSMMAMLQI